MAQAQTSQDVLNWINNDDIQLIDLKFVDPLGTWQHLTIHPDLLEEDSFTEGVAFDGSSIRGWKSIHESDMAMRPDPLTAWIDPFMKEPTLSLICTIVEPRTGSFMTDVRARSLRRLWTFSPLPTLGTPPTLARRPSSSFLTMSALTKHRIPAFTM